MAHGFFVIDNRNQCLRHKRISGACRSAGARARLSATDAISHVSDNGMLCCPVWGRNNASFHFLCTIPFVTLEYCEMYGIEERASLRTSLSQREKQ